MSPADPRPVQRVAVIEGDDAAPEAVRPTIVLVRENLEDLYVRVEGELAELADPAAC